VTVDAKDDENSLKDFAFLTGVNIQGAEVPKEVSEGEFEEEEEEERIELVEIKERNSNFRESRGTSDDLLESYPRGADIQKNLKAQTSLPPVKKSTFVNSDKPAMSVSEARYHRHMNQKPKMYISFKTNSVQAFGRPANYKEHLTRVYNKESTPTVPYQLVDHLGAKKDIRKTILESYLSQYNLEALKEIDENLYEYAKQRAEC